MDLALSLAERSTCARLKVGCIVTDLNNTRVLAVGYNGNYKGGRNGCDTFTPGACGCLHAEDNALLKLDYYGSSKVMYVTHLPCFMCAKRIINAGIHQVIYLNEYRKDEAKLILPNVLQYVDHRQHGREGRDGPDESDCECRQTVRQMTCAMEGCGFCIAAKEEAHEGGARSVTLP